MQNLINFCESQGIKYNANKNAVVGRSGHAVHSEKIYAEYVKVCTKPEDFIPLNEFHNKLFETVKSQHTEKDNDKEFIFPTVWEIEDLIKQAMEYQRISFSKKGDQIFLEGTPDTIDLS